MTPRPEGARWGWALVRGDSMAPTLHEGDRLLVRYAAVPRPGAVAVVRFDDGVLAVKRLDHAVGPGVDGPWWVARDNPDRGRDSWSAGAVEVVGLCAGRVWPRPRLLRARPVTP